MRMPRRRAARPAMGLLLAAGPVLAVTVGRGRAAVLVQTGFLVHGAALMPDLGAAGPTAGAEARPGRRTAPSRS